MRSRGSWGALTAFIMALLASGSCGTAVDGIGVVMGFTNTPASATKINIKFTINNMPQKQAEPYVLTSDLTRFAVGITDTSAGTLLVDADAVDDTGCIVGRGQAMISIVVGTTSLESVLDFTPVALCPLRLKVVGIGSTTEGIVRFEGKAYMDGEYTIEIDRGKMVTATVNRSKNIFGGTWSEDCSGTIPTPCTVTADRARQISMTFSKRPCTTSPTPICTYQTPAGSQLRSSLLTSPFPMFGGNGLYRYNYMTYSFDPVSSNLPTTSLLRTLSGDPAGTMCVLFEDGNVWCTTINGDLTSFASVTLPGSFGTIQAMSAGPNFFVVTDTGQIGDVNSGTRTIAVQTVTNTMPLYGVSEFTTAGNDVAVGQGGVIFRRSGGTWSSVSSGVTQTLRSVHQRNGGIWIVGDGGIIIRAASAAGPYSTVTNAGANLKSVIVKSGGNFWAVGDNAAVQFGNSASTTQQLPPGSMNPNLIHVNGYDDSGAPYMLSGGDLAFYQ